MSQPGSDPPPKKYQLGILFVHGIGEQPEGETLLTFGEPILNWMRRWLSRTAGTGLKGRIDITKAILTSSKLKQQAPPHAEVQLHLDNNGQTSISSWLLAESWWGGQVHRPAFRKMAGWMITSGAWVILSHASKWARTYRNPKMQVLARIFVLLMWLPITLLFQFSVLILSLLALLPIPRIRQWLSYVLLTLTGFLGDTYVLIESDLQRSAIVNKTRAALSWMAKDCDQVIVIAHSQGAAVAHHALRGSKPDEISLLLTFGSGLGKIEELFQIRKNSGKFPLQVMPVLIFSLAVIEYLIVHEPQSSFTKPALFFVGGGALMSFMYVFKGFGDYWSNFAQLAKDLRLEPGPRKLQWLDVYASHDFVPNGALAPPGTIAEYTYNEVVNRQSVITDHMSYWTNQCEFVPYVVRAIDDKAKLNLFTESDKKKLDQAAATHQDNVRWWIITRWATRLSVILLFWLYWNQLHVQGGATLRTLEGLSTHAVSVLHGLKVVARRIFPFLSDTCVSELGLGILGAAVPLALIAGWRYIYFLFWRRRDNLAIEQEFRPLGLSHPVDRFLLNLFFWIAGLFPVLAVLAWPFVKVTLITISHLLWVTYFSLSTLGLLFLITSFTIKLSSRFKQAWHGEGGIGKKLWEELWALGAGIVLVLILNGALIYILLPKQTFPVVEKVTGYFFNFFMLIIVWEFSFRSHGTLLAKVKGSTARHVAFLGPFIIAFAYLCRSIFSRLPLLSEEGLLDWIFNLLLSSGGAYMLTVFIGHGIIWLTNWWCRDRSQP